jgi:hypothetical protein
VLFGKLKKGCKDKNFKSKVPDLEMSSFGDHFCHATGNARYANQRRLAGAVEGPAPSGPFPCHSQLINIPAA